MRQVSGWGDVLGVWDGNAMKFGCDDHCTTINVVKFVESFKNIIVEQKEEKSQINDLSLHLQELEKEKEIKPKGSKRK